MGKWACHEKNPVIVSLYWDLDLSQLYIDCLQQVHIGALYSLSMESKRALHLVDGPYRTYVLVLALIPTSRLFGKIKSIY